jgi:hypothetical protein
VSPSWPEALRRTLDLVAEAGARIEEPWWLFGGAAAALYGLKDEIVPDVDVLTTPAGCAAWAEALGGETVAPPPGELFRSGRLHRVTTGPLPIEIMTGLEVEGPAGWSPVAFSTRLEKPWGEGRLFVPGPSEHAQVSRRIGRAKDLRRAARIDLLEVR